MCEYYNTNNCTAQGRIKLLGSITANGAGLVAYQGEVVMELGIVYVI